MKFFQAVELPAAGLTLKIMAGAREAPADPPTVYAYRYTGGGQDLKVDRYVFGELWAHGQYAGRWIDPYGNTLTLAALTRPCPADPLRRGTREEYAQALVEASPAPVVWTEEALTRWVSGFMGAPNVRLQAIASHPYKIKRLFDVGFEAAPAAASRLAFLFLMNAQAPGQFGAPSNWFYAQFDLAEGADAGQARAAIGNKFFDGLTAVAAARRMTGAPIAAPQPAVRVGGATTNQPAAAADRRQVQDSIRNLKNWWFVETPHYILLSNLKSKNGPLVRHLQANIETLRNAFEQFMPARAPIQAVSVIRLFAEADEYLAFVGDGHAWSAGLWMPSTRELVIRPAEWGDNLAQRERILGTAYHEAFHQYLYYAFDRLEPSVWFNEGHAALFDTAEIDDDRIELKENPQHLQRLDPLLKSGALPLSALLRMSYPEFYGGDDAARGEHYALAWALVYYLRLGAAVEKPPRYTGLLDAYREELWRTQDAGRATDAAFAGIALQALSADVVRFWTSPGKRSAAARGRVLNAAGSPKTAAPQGR